MGGRCSQQGMSFFGVELEVQVVDLLINVLIEYQLGYQLELQAVCYHIFIFVSSSSFSSSFLKLCQF